MLKMLQEQRLIEVPTVGQVMAFERKLEGERREMFQEAFDVLHDVGHAKSDPVIGWKLNNLKNLLKGFKRVERESGFKNTRPAGVLRIKARVKGEEYDLGLASVDKVTNNGVAYIIDAIQALATIENLKWHGSGTGVTAEATGDSALVTEVGSRVAGTQIEGASANIYKTVATITYGATYSITEHGLFSASTSGTLFDRSVFTAIGVDTSTNIEFTYEYTLNAEA